MKETENISVELALSSEGNLYLNNSVHAFEQVSTALFERLDRLFSKDATLGLLHLGIEEFPVLPPSFSFWQAFARKFVARICKMASNEELSTLLNVPLPSDEELQQTLNQGLFIKGAEYIDRANLVGLWKGMAKILHANLLASGSHIQGYLQSYNANWNQVGRVCFHLAENKNSEQYPFAFLATYTTQLSSETTTQHLPLNKALQEYAGEKNRTALNSLLIPIQKASEKSEFISKLLETKQIFAPQAWTPRQAHTFLQQIPLLEACGIVVRVPNWWSSQKPPRPQIVVKIGESTSGGVGLGTLLNFDIGVALTEGENLSPEDWHEILNAKGELIKIKGKWIEVDKEKLTSVLSHWNQLQKGMSSGLSMAEGLRLLSGRGLDLFRDGQDEAAENTAQWSTVIAGNWLKEALEKLRNPQSDPANDIKNILQGGLQATLRPYQLAGVDWLWLLYRLKLGGCLADDMGLGKTIQVLSLLLLVQKENAQVKKPSLLVVPATLLGNWQAECSKFTPSLRMVTIHSSSLGSKAATPPEGELKEIDIVLTTYSFVYRLEWLKNVDWNLIILDEAQLIKNPGTKQTRAIKALQGEVKLTLTGTPVENRLSDLWSLFDFTSPGLLGSSSTFASHAKSANKHAGEHYGRFVSTLRTLTQPYILRRLKSDKKVIADLPDKTEVQTYCSLSREQVKIYQQGVDELAERLKTTSGVERRGLVLSYILRFKQICNHPSQWLGYGEYAPENSGKFSRLKDICEEIAAKQEKVLIFTQFREIIAPLARFVSEIFGRPGLILHGDTPVKKRAELVESFQQEQGPPFFVLSLKAGGTGLTLTRASHVIHFDRWWNPAVENQATDRAYRIGQKHPVLVHKFIVSGTIEENIDSLIASKFNLSQELLQGGNELTLTEMSDQELLNIVSLDLKKTIGEF